MSRLVVRCPKCEHKESVMSSRPGSALPPCPRCEDFVRMEDITPGPGESDTVISTAGSQATDTSQPVAQPAPAPAPAPKRRDPRDFGPEPRA